MNSNFWKLEFDLIGTKFPSLKSSSFICPYLEEKVENIIGVSISPYKKTIPWTITTAIFVAFAIQAKLIRTQKSTLKPLFEGGPDSIAKTLEWIINKQRTGLDIFGHTKHGRPIFNQFIKILNFKKSPCLPRLVYLQETAFPSAESIVIRQNGIVIEDEKTLARLRDYFVNLVEGTKENRNKILILEAA